VEPYNAALKYARRLWNFLTTPHPDLIEVEERRQSRLLSTMILAVMTLSAIASLILMTRSGITPTIIGVWVGIALSWLFYLLNRRGNYHTAAIGFICLNFVLIHTMPFLTAEPAWMLFSTMLIVLTAVFIPNWAGRVFLSSFVFQMITGFVSPLRTEISVLGIAVVFLVTAPLVLMFLRHRFHLEKERQQELQQINASLRESEMLLEKRVEERTLELRIAHEEAEGARMRAENSDKVTQRFLASMSHELRTPLNAILNFTEFVATGMLGPINDQQHDVLVKSLGSARHLLDLINDLLDNSKIQSGLMQLVIERDIDLHTEFEQVMEATRVLLQEKPVTLIGDIDPMIPVIHADRRRIRQILLNLLSNAAKFTHIGSITLRARLEADTVHCIVIDTGPGIAKEEQDRIFEPFTQTQAGMHHSGGTGLGLAISRGLAEAHGGKLWVESEQGNGSAFHLILPVEPSKQRVVSVAE
jgi:signal transduction histidine kinase